MRLRFLPILLSCTTLVCAIVPTAAEAQAWPMDGVVGEGAAMGAAPGLGWSGSLALGAGRAPYFSGSRESRTGPLLGLNAAYTTRSAGSWHLGTGGLGWSQQRGGMQFGVALGADLGRSDHGEGRAPLNGLGDLGSTPLVTLFAGTRLGPVPVVASVSKATRSHRGTQLNLTLPLRVALSEALTLRSALVLGWADSRTMQAYYGVTAVQAARTSYRAYDAGSGWRSVGLNLGLDYRLDGQLHLLIGGSVQRLAGAAGRSPLVGRRQQVRSMLMLSYQF